jgi:hypothetical protein
MKPKRSDIFHFKRWCSLLSKHWTENGKKYGLFLLAYAGLLLTWYSFILVMNDRGLIDVDIQFTSYFIGLYLAGCLYASTLFADLNSRREGVNYLALPASQLEKMLCVLFFGVLIFFMAYTVVFYLIDIPMVQLSNRILEKHPRYFLDSRIKIPTSIVYNIFTAVEGPIPERLYHVFLLGFFSIQAIFILGPLYFSRYALIKSIVVVLLILILGVIVEQKIVNYFLPQGWYAQEFSWVQYDEAGHPSRYIFLPGSLTKITSSLLQWGLPLLIWVITYYRLKEKQI